MNQRFIPQPEGRRPYRDMSALRDALMTTRLDEMTSHLPLPGADDERRLVTSAIEQLQAGRSFDFGRVDLEGQAFHARLRETYWVVEEALGRGELSLPYDVFAATARVVSASAGIDHLMLFAAEAEPDGSLFCFANEPMINELGGTDFLPLPCPGRVIFRDGRAIMCPITSYAAAEAGPALIVVGQLLFFMLAALADNRVPLVRKGAPEKVNKARMARRRPPIPARWQVDVDNWVTKVSKHRKERAESGGGRHKSPVPHNRRGHQRRLSSGKVTWVRPSWVGEIAKHMTRHREFYRIEGSRI